VEHKENHNEILQFIHDHHIMWQGSEANYAVMGSLSMDVSSLRVSLHIEKEGLRKQRIKLDLYDYSQVTKHVTHLSEEEGFVFGHLETDILKLTELLENHREQLYNEAYAETKPSKKTNTLAIDKQKEVVEFLKQPNLLASINEQLGNIGIAGEVDNRLLLFILGTSYKHEPLHAVIQSSSGSGKSHLINTIADCFPEEDVLSLSRITSKSLYHYKHNTLKNKLILIQDFDGLDDEALFAFRELQSFGKLTTSMTGKDAFGDHTAKLHTVHGHFASFGASTKELYTDNQSRSILLKIDESEEQTRRVLSYTPPTSEEILKTKNELQNIVRLLKPYSIFNPFVDKLCLPHTIPMARRLNNQLKQFIEQITFIHQYQREQDAQGRLITTLEDIKTGISLFMECLWLKVDELPVGTRNFFEELKAYITEQESSKEFNQRDIRNNLSVSRSALHRHITTLIKMEYIQVVSGTANKGYRYMISYFDNAEKLKQELIQGLEKGVLG
jgi:hypothetical protein